MDLKSLILVALCLQAANCETEERFIVEISDHVPLENCTQTLLDLQVKNQVSSVFAKYKRQNFKFRFVRYFQLFVFN